MSPIQLPVVFRFDRPPPPSKSPRDDDAVFKLRIAALESTSTFDNLYNCGDGMLIVKKKERMHDRSSGTTILGRISSGYTCW